MKKMHPHEIEKLIANLGAHQIELKTQNEELRKAHLEIERVKDKYIDLFDFAPLGYFTIDEEGVISEVNLTGASLLGLNKQSIVGQPFHRFVYRDDQDTFYLHRRKIAKGKERVISELRLVRGDGTRCMVEMTGVFVSGQIRESVTEITERKQIEEALRVSEEQFRKAIKDAPIPVIVHAEDGQVLQISRTWTELTGYTRKDMPTFEAWLNQAYGYGADEVRNHVHELFKGSKHSIGIEFPVRTRAGETRYWSFSASSPGTLRDGRRFVVGMAVDITERKQAEEKLEKYRWHLEEIVRERTATLEHKNKELQDFAFIASHDLNEPLRKIQTFGSFLETKGFLDEKARDYVSRMTGAADRMRELLGALLRYSRLETREEEFVPTTLNDVVQGVMDDLEAVVNKLQAKVEVETLPTVICDPPQFRQLFQDLIANALKYHRSGVQPHIKITGRDSDGTTQVFVEDNGIGFEEKYLDKIFQPFQRLHGRIEYPGVGIGLAVCKKIVERHGGTITAKSTPGKGSTFIVTLPVSTEKQRSNVNHTPRSDGF